MTIQHLQDLLGAARRIFPEVEKVSRRVLQSGKKIHLWAVRRSVDESSLGMALHQRNQLLIQTRLPCFHTKPARPREGQSLGLGIWRVAAPYIVNKARSDPQH